MRRAIHSAVLVLVAVGCSKPVDKPSGEAVGDAGAAIAHAPVAEAAAPSAAAPATVSFAGKYTSSAGTLYIPPDWKSVHWTVPDSPAGLGEGTLSLTVDGATGRVLGTVTGPLGPATLAGLASDGKISATIARQDASDRGFAGTLIGALVGDHGEGTIQVSLAEVSAVRTATFSLSRDRADSAPAPGATGGAAH
jgi:hypothetical protein